MRLQKNDSSRFLFPVACGDVFFWLGQHWQLCRKVLKIILLEPLPKTIFYFFQNKYTIEAALTMTATFTYTLVLAAIYIGRKLVGMRTQAA
jgi:hypothetical protein